MCIAIGAWVSLKRDWCSLEHIEQSRRIGGVAEHGMLRGNRLLLIIFFFCKRYILPCMYVYVHYSNNNVIVGMHSNLRLLLCCVHLDHMLLEFLFYGIHK